MDGAAVRDHMLRQRPQPQDVPDLAAGTKVAAARLMTTPDPENPSLAILERTAGQLGVRLFSQPFFLTQSGAVQLFWVSPDMCRLLRKAAEELPGVCRPVEAISHPIATHGFVVFGEPILSWVSSDDPLGPVVMGGLAWLGGVIDLRNGQRLGWFDFTGKVEPDAPGVVSLGVVPLGPQPSPRVRGLVPLTSSHLVPTETLDQHIEGERSAGMTPEGTADHDEDRRLLLALMILLDSRITATKAQPLERAVRRRAARAEVPSDVRVIYLRRPEAVGAPKHGETPVEWSHRWVVSGHWRNQPCGHGRSDRRLTWVSPYVKGPEDKPLVVRPTIGALVR